MKSFVHLVVVASCLCAAIVSAPIAVMAASPASAAPSPSGGLPQQLAQQLTDETGLLSADTDQINAALQQLYDSTGVHLYVLFVNSTGTTKISDYAVSVGESSNLGSRDALLVVAVQDQTDQISLRPDLVASVSQQALDQVRVKTLETKLSTGDYADAVIETANDLADVFGAPPTGTSAGTATFATDGAEETVAAPDATPASTDSTSTGGGTPSVLTVAALLILLIGVVLIVGRSMRRRPPKQT